MHVGQEKRHVSRMKIEWFERPCKTFAEKAYEERII